MRKEVTHPIVLDLPCGYVLAIQRTSKTSRPHKIVRDFGALLERALRPDRTVERAIAEINHSGVAADFDRANAPAEYEEPIEDRVERDHSNDLPEENAEPCTGYGWRWIWN